MPRRILVVEDDPGVARLLELGLSRLLSDVTVTRAGHGAAALERLRAQERYDLILCDLMMPVMDGIRFVQGAQEEGVNQAPILLLTAVDEEQVAQARALPNVVGYIRKPVDLSQLVDEVAKILG
ncbi:MAG: response regulator [Deltaproteobacteria bacterium]|nr:response regulator [Deltaproteobacteria bacterium]